MLLSAHAAILCGYLRCCPPMPLSSPRHPSHVTTIPCRPFCAVTLPAFCPPCVAAIPVPPPSLRCCSPTPQPSLRRPPRLTALPNFYPPHATILPMLMSSMSFRPPHFIAVVPELRVVKAIPLTMDERPLHPHHQSHCRAVYLGRSATNIATVRIAVVLIAIGHEWST